LRRDAEDRITTLEGEIEQLRGQCDVLGRGLAEDQTLHVAYSQSMRRVQTRAIELAPMTEPVLLIAPAGSPVLPVSRFIHDRLPALSKLAQTRLAEALSAHNKAPGDDDGPRPVRPRMIATSRVPLSELRWRSALEPALASCFAGPALTIPPLRERREDVPSLALLAIDRACRVLARDPVGIEQQAMEALVDHDWPGDVAELELVVELAVAKASGKTVAFCDLPPLAWPSADDGESLRGTYLEVERRLLERALLRSGGNKSEAARMLGLKRTTFLDKIRRHGLEQRAAG